MDGRHVRVGTTLSGQADKFHLERLAGLDDVGKTVGVIPHGLDRSFLDGSADKDCPVAVPDRENPLDLEGSSADFPATSS